MRLLCFNCCLVILCKTCILYCICIDTTDWLCGSLVFLVFCKWLFGWTSLPPSYCLLIEGVCIKNFVMLIATGSSPFCKFQKECLDFCFALCCIWKSANLFLILACSRTNCNFLLGSPAARQHLWLMNILLHSSHRKYFCFHQTLAVR